ncbi:MAG: hypothetical protein Unbinned4388contig1000_22 [Prokaryotic dsDNA virus sp.]|nr:MAG: hypothetical protein Unbinned4388contig1000_22 [Prokaryotic dsDNA virus sp.]|tara:strand:+ start:40089 stop:41510 length:1422 start_codon:yes stop_codon:yes gene_type:complete
MASSQFYQGSYQRQPSLADDIYKGEALENQRQALGQGRQAAKNKQTELKPLTKGWAAHSGAIQKASEEIMEGRWKAQQEGDRAAVAQWDRKWNTLRTFSNDSEQLGSRWGKGESLINSGSSNYTEEIIGRYKSFPNLHAESVGTDGEGNVTFEGRPIYEGGYNPLLNIPDLPNKGESWYMKTMSVDPPDLTYRTDANGNKIYKEEPLQKWADGMTQEGLDAGFLTQEQAPIYNQKMMNLHRNESSFKDKDESSSKTEKDPWDEVYTKVGVVPIPASESSAVANSDGMTFASSGKTILDADGRPLSLTSFTVDDKGELYVQGVLKQDDIMVLLEKQKAATEGLTEGTPEYKAAQEKFVEQVMKDKKDAPVEKYNANKHSNLISPIAKYIKNPTEKDIIKMIYESNGKSRTINGYSDEDLQPLVSSSIKIEDLRNYPRGVIKKWLSEVKDAEDIQGAGGIASDADVEEAKKGELD